MVGIPFSLAMPSPNARHTQRAIISSSSVRMTRTVARLASVEIDSEVSALCDSFSICRRVLMPILFLMGFGNGSKVLA
jgi:hypothetical protein